MHIVGRVGHRQEAQTGAIDGELVPNGQLNIPNGKIEQIAEHALKHLWDHSIILTTTEVVTLVIYLSNKVNALCRRNLV